jgi:hypothetical protein
MTDWYKQYAQPLQANLDPDSVPQPSLPCMTPSQMFEWRQKQQLAAPPEKPKEAGDLQKLVEQWAKSAGFDVDGEFDGQTQWICSDVQLQALCRLAMQHAAEEAAKCCEDKERRKWEILTVGRPIEGIGPLDCAHAIRERFKAL